MIETDNIPIDDATKIYCLWMQHSINSNQFACFFCPWLRVFLYSSLLRRLHISELAHPWIDCKVCLQSQENIISSIHSSFALLVDRHIPEFPGSPSSSTDFILQLSGDASSENKGQIVGARESLVRPFRLSLAPTIYPWVSEDAGDVIHTILLTLLLFKTRTPRFLRQNSMSVSVLKIRNVMTNESASSRSSFTYSLSSISSKLLVDSPSLHNWYLA